MGEPVTVGRLPWRGLFRSVLVSVSVCSVVTVAVTQEETIKEGGWGWRGQRDSTIEKGVMGVGEGSVCAR